MPDENSRAPRRRPVDVLFGEQVELKPKPTTPETDVRVPQPPGYMVEPPRPVTSVRPPPPEFPSDWRAVAPPEPVTVVELPTESVLANEPVDEPPTPALAADTEVETIAEATTFTVSSDDGNRQPPSEPVTIFVPPAPSATSLAPAVTIPPALPPKLTSIYGQAELLELSQFVDQLYQNVAEETSDSAALNAECLAKLNAARIALEQGEYAKTEAAAEFVKGRLLRARASRASAVAPTTRLLFAWLVVASLLGVALFVVPFAVRIVPVVIPFLRGVGMGLLGGAAVALWQLSLHISRRDYDAAFNFKYATSPLQGALIGVALYLLSLLGIVAAPNALGITIEPYLLMYLFALLGGIFNDSILRGLRAIASELTPRKM